jgi:hypothetical protein
MFISFSRFPLLSLPGIRYYVLNGQAVPCPAGYYCAGGTNIQSCPAGKFNGKTLQSTSDACLPCAEGYWCSGTPINLVVKQSLCSDLEGATVYSTTTFGSFSDITSRDFVGDFVYAIDVGGSGTTNVKDASFQVYSAADVVFSSATTKNTGKPTLIESSMGTKSWGNAMSTVLATNMNHDSSIILTLNNVPAFKKYRLQLFSMEREQTSQRSFTVNVNGKQVITDFNPLSLQGNKIDGSVGAYLEYSFLFSNSNKQLVVQLSGTRPMLNALTLETMPSEHFYCPPGSSYPLSVSPGYYTPS